MCVCALLHAPCHACAHAVGTPMYMSPECIRGQPYDFKSDVWSLGCLFYEFITLRNPFFQVRPWCST